MERETGRIVTKVNLNEEPSVTFKVSNLIWLIINDDIIDSSGIHNDVRPNHQGSQILYHKYKNYFYSCCFFSFFMFIGKIFRSEMCDY